MTISTELRKAGPFTGNGVTTAFPFSFKVFAATDVTATRADTLGAETGLVLNTDFTVALNADQDAAPGGTVTLAAPLSTGYRLVVSSAVPNLQPTDITNNGGFYPRVIEDALDRHVAQVQQIDEKVGRALKVAITSPLGDQALPSPVAGMLIGWNESSDGLKNYAPIGGTLLGQQLAAAYGSSLVGFQQSGTGAVVRTAQDKMREVVSAGDFGVIGDGVADDSNALEAALQKGVPISLGAMTIKVTRKISFVASGALHIIANGSKITNGSATAIEAVLDIEVLPGFEHRIDGKLTINGNSKAFLGLRIWNKSAVGFPGGYADVVLNDVEVRNIRRASTEFSNGDGIIVRGGFQSVQINRPVVKGVALAAGAGVPGSVGVSGIAVFGADTGYPIHTVINDPLIDSIYSEDTAYSHDQDGIRIFGPHATALGYRNSTAVVNGGQFRNCWGRSIKLQTDTGVVSNCNFSAYEGPTGGRSSEIDFQVGSGSVRDISCYYSGGNSVPAEIVVFQSNEFWESFAGVAAGIKVFTTSLIAQIVATYPRARTQHQTVIRDVDVIGPITRLFEFRVWSDKSTALVSGCTINNATEGLVRVTASGLAGSPYLGTVNVRDCVNLGAAVALVTDRVAGISAIAKVSDIGCVGFLSQAIFSDTVTPKGGALRVNALIGNDDQTGALRIASASIADGETTDFAVQGYNGTTAAAIVSFGLSNQSQALIGISSSGVIKMAGGTAIQVGTITEPATGSFRLWFSGGVLKVKNAAGSTRQCTIFFMG